MTSPQLTVRQFAAICTGSNTPPWQLKIQPSQPPNESVSLKSHIAQLSETQVIVFAGLRNWSIFENYPGSIPPYMQQYIFNRTCLSTEDLQNLMAVLSENNLELVYLDGTMQNVGIRGTMGDLTAINFGLLGQITSKGNTLTSSTTAGPGGAAQNQIFIQNGTLNPELLTGPGTSGTGVGVAKAGSVWAAQPLSIVNAGAAAYAMAVRTISATGYGPPMVALADAAAATEAQRLLSGGEVATDILITIPAEEPTATAIGLVYIGPVGMALSGAAFVGTGSYLTHQCLNSPLPPPPISTPLTPPNDVVPLNSPQNVPLPLPVINPIITDPPTYSPQPVALRNGMISSTPYSADVTLNEFAGGVNAYNPLFPNSYSALVSNSLESPQGPPSPNYSIADPYAGNQVWKMINAGLESRQNLQTGTGPTLGVIDLGTSQQITNPATGQVISCLCPAPVFDQPILGQDVFGTATITTTAAISDSMVGKTQTTTTVATVNQAFSGLTQIETTQILSPYKILLGL